VKRILLTGLSGTGKSTVISELDARGYKAVDADCDEFSEWVEIKGDSDTPGSPVKPDRDWVWQEDRIQKILSTEEADGAYLGLHRGGHTDQEGALVLLEREVGHVRELLVHRVGEAVDERARQREGLG
jgi:predicted ATPase